MNNKNLLLTIAIALGGVALVAVAYVLTTNKSTVAPAPDANIEITTPVAPVPAPAPAPAPIQNGEQPTAKTAAASDISQSGATLNGQINPNASVTTYWFEYGSTTNLGSKTTPTQFAGAGQESVSAATYLSGLAPNSAYYFALVAKNQFGTTRGDVLQFTTTNVPPPPIKLPTAETQSAVNVALSGAVLKGLVLPNNAATWYWFSYGGAGLEQNTGLVYAGSGSAIVPASATLDSLNPDTTYYFRLNVQNQYGTVTGQTLNFKTLKPLPAPGAPKVQTNSASNITRTSASLRGTVNPNGAAATYWFEYGLTSALGTTTASANAGSDFSTTTVSAPLNSLTRGTTYFFRLVAKNQYDTVAGSVLKLTTK